MLKIRRNSIGWRLREERVRRGMTQRQVADIVGMTPAAITQYERNHHPPSLRTMELLAKFFGVPLEYLLRGINPPPARKVEEARSPVELQVLNLFRRTPEDAHAGMLEVLRVTSKYTGSDRR